MQARNPSMRSIHWICNRSMSYKTSTVNVIKSSVTQRSDTRFDHEISTPSSLDKQNATSLVDMLLELTSNMISLQGSNVIAFSGGVDSSLVAALVQRSFYASLTSINNSSSSIKGKTTAILGISPAVPDSQIDLARHIAHDIIKIPLLEIPTNEGTDETYIANKGEACLACKNHLYSTLKSVASHAVSPSAKGSSSSGTISDIILFNGTNKDDTNDPTRLGLIAADNFQVRSPLRGISKEEVRIAAKHLGLPNWNYAASPCLRSRLALGIEATSKHLKMVEKGEIFVRNVLHLGMEQNLRLRLLSGGRAGVEVDETLFDTSSIETGDLNGGNVKTTLINAGFESFLEEIGFKNGEFVVRKFKTGAVSGAPIK